MMDHRNTCCVIGGTQLAIECCKVLLCNGFDIQHVFTDDTLLVHWAQKLGIQNESKVNFRNTPLHFFSQFDYLFSIVNDIKVPQRILGKLRKLSINYHNGPLPKYAGTNATHWALINGEKTHGVVWHIMDKDFDSGSILVQEMFHINVDTEDALSDLNLLCKVAAEKSLSLLCYQLRTSLIRPLSQSSHNQIYFYRYDKPSAFCYLPMNCPAAVTNAFFHGTACKGPYTNELGLPKIYLPKPVDKILVVSDLEVLQHSPMRDDVQPGTVVHISNSIVLTTQDKDISIKGLLELDGTEVRTPFIHSVGEMLNRNLEFSDAHIDHSVWKCGRISDNLSPNSEFWKLSTQAGKCERKWVKDEKNKCHVVPLSWPYYTFAPSSNADESCSKFKELRLLSVKGALLDRLMKSVADIHLSPQVALLSSFMNFILMLSPSFSGSFDVKTKIHSDSAVHSKFLLQYIPVSLNYHSETSPHFKKCLSEIAAVLESAFDSTVASDVYLRYQIEKPNSLIAVAFAPNKHFNIEEFYSCHHHLSLLSCHQGDESEVVILALQNGHKSILEHQFDTVEEDFLNFLEKALSNDQPVTTIPLCSPDTLEIITKKLSGPTQTITNSLLHTPVEEIAKQFPHVVALVDEVGCHTYSDLMGRASQIAAWMQEKCSTLVTTVVLLLQRTWEVVASMLAAMKLGACFVTLEPDFPSHIVRNILEDCKADVVIVDSAGISSADMITECGAYIFDLNEIVYGLESTELCPPISSNLNPAFIMYTSGTTGKPKGVQIEHRGICNYIEQVIETFGLQRTKWDSCTGMFEIGEYALQSSSHAFDACVHELFSVLWIGGTVIMYPTLPSAASNCSTFLPYVTFLHTQPIKLSLFNPKRFKSLQTVSYGGDAPTLELIGPWKGEGRTLWNLYGPTEITVATTFGRGTAMGDPLANTYLRILNPAKQPVPVGVAGELYVGGEDLARGYTNPELTEKVFFMDETNSSRWYRTGDLVYLDANLALNFVGRIPKDRQVKLFGARIELLGIETLLRQIPGVRFAHVQIESISESVKHLVAYIAPENLKASYIKEILSKQLPKYNIPSVIVCIPHCDVLIGTTGKLVLDRKKYRGFLASSKYKAPNNDTEKTLLKLYQKFLGIVDESVFGMSDDFTFYGGTSVAALQLAGEINSLLCSNVSSLDIINLHTPEAVLHKYRLTIPSMPRQQSLIDNHLQPVSEKGGISSMQEALLSMNSITLGPTYNIANAVEITGAINALQLIVAVERVLPLLHEPYILSSVPGTPLKSHKRLHHVDLAHLPDNEAKCMALKMIQKDAVIPIELQQRPYRSTLYSISKQSHILSLIIHHIVFDHISVDIFYHLIEMCYNRDLVPHSSVEEYVPFSEFVRSEKNNYEEKKAEVNAFWKNHLKDCKAHVNFPGILRCPHARAYIGKRCVLTLDEKLSMNIMKACEALSVQPTCFFLSVFGLLIAKLSGNSDFGVGVNISRRTTARLKRVIGFVANTVICCFAEKELLSPFAKLLQTTEKWLYEASRYSSVPFLVLSKLLPVDTHGDSTHPYHTPQFLFNFLHVTESATLSLGARATVKTLKNFATFTAKCELELDVLSMDNHFKCQWEYNSSLYSPEAAAFVTEMYSALLSLCVSNVHKNGLNLTAPLGLPHLQCTAQQELCISNVGTQCEVDFSPSQEIVYRELSGLPLDSCALFHGFLTVEIGQYVVIEKVRSALKNILSMHPKVLLRVSVDDGKAHLSPMEEVCIPIFEETAVSEVEENVMTLCHEHWPFDMFKGPLFRLRLLHCTYSPRMSKLHIVFHQLLMDRKSAKEFAQQLNDFLTIGVPPTNPLTDDGVHIPFGHADLHVDYWSEKLEQTCKPFSLSTHSVSGVGLVFARLLQSAVIEEHFDLGSITDCTITCAAFSSLFLCQLQQCTNTLFGIVLPHVSNASILPVSIQLDPVASIQKFLATVGKSLKDSQLHAPFSYWQFQEELDSSATYLNPYIEAVAEVDLSSTDQVSLCYHQPFRITLHFSFAEKTVILRTSLNPLQTCVVQRCFRKVLQYFKILLVSGPETSLAQFDTTSLSQSESYASLDGPPSPCLECTPFLDMLLGESGNQYTFSHSVAYSVLGNIPCHLTHQEAWHQSSLLASHISHAVISVCKDQKLKLVVGILTTGGLELPIAVMASLQARYPFCILDPADGENRLFEKIGTSNIPNLILVCDAEASEMAMNLATVLSNITVVLPFCTWMEPFLVPFHGCHETTHTPDLDDCAYIVFTSGSTGKPKGVPVKYESLINFLFWVRKSLFNSDTLELRWLQYSGLSFDGCILDILVPWLSNQNSYKEDDDLVCCGSTLFLLDSSQHPKPKLDFPYVLKCIRQYSIECIFSVPSILRQFFKMDLFASNHLPHLKYVISIGEELKHEDCSLFFQHFPPEFSPAELHNWYGPAECCIAVTDRNVNKQTHLSAIEIGTPVCNTNIHIVSPNSTRQLPQGFPGEIVIEGLAVFNGYLSESTPEPSHHNRYHTGDFGYINARGQLVWLQRCDRQVKISGERIELDEICNKIHDCSLPYITDVIVDTYESEGHPKSLICYLEVTDEKEFTRDRVQTDLAQYLPKKLLPTVVKCMNEYPRLPSHKVDWKSLKKSVTAKVLPSKYDESIHRPHSLKNITAVLLNCLSETVPSAHFSDSHLELPLDMLGLSSMLKAKFWQLLHDRHFPVTMSSILTCRNIFDLARKIQCEKSEYSPLVLAQQVPHIRSHDDVAIISVELNVPGATSIDEFWKVITEQQETVSHNLPPDPNHHVNEMKGSYYVGSRGLITDKGHFDAALFGIDPNHAKLMDPQQRLLLHSVWSALEKAGYDPHKFADEMKIGCFVGVHFPSYFLNNIWNTEAAVEAGFLQEFEVMVECIGESIALHLGRYLDFRGPCVYVSHTCSTFSAALHYARLSLLQQECDIAVVAAASLSPFDEGYIHTVKGVFSSDGHCSPFSHSATGTVLSDGLVVVVMRLLSDAESQHDEILCVVKGSAIGSDGSQAQSRVYAPSKQGQVQTLQQAFKSSGVSPSSISLVEAHGTGTKVGDAIELESLKCVFEDPGISNQSVVLGSVKGNIGHTEAASAGCSIIKVALAMKHSVLPPSMNCDNPLPSLETSPFCILHEPKLWISHSPRRALVHSVGMKGANSAVILEEYVVPHAKVDDVVHHDQSMGDIYYPLCISAGSKWSLHALSMKIIGSIADYCYSARDIAYTIAISRKNLSYRTSAAVSSEQELLDFLNEARNQQVAQVPVCDTCILFGPQGSKLDMNCFRQFYYYSRSFRKTVKEGFKFLQEMFSNDVCNLESLLQDGNDSSLMKRHPIPAVLAVICEIGIYNFLKEECSLQETLVGGHSLGEYTAACVAGAFTFEEVLAIVFKRGQLVEQYAPYGKMLAVRCSGQKMASNYLHLQEFSSMTVSCFNSPIHSVVSGPSSQIESLMSELDKHSIKYRLLEVDYAYHHPSMEIVQCKFENFLSQFTPKPLHMRLVTSLSKRSPECILEYGSRIPLQYWVKHLTVPVDFLSAMKQIEENLRSLPHALIEIGPSRQLKPLVNKINPQISLHCVPLTCSIPPESSHKLLHYHTALALTDLWKLGVDLDLHRMSAFAGAKRIPLPTYPFDCKRYWVNPDPLNLSAGHRKTHEQSQLPVLVPSIQPDSQEDVEANLRKWAGRPSSTFSDVPIESHRVVYFTNQVLEKYGVDIDHLVEEGSYIKDIATYVCNHTTRNFSALFPVHVKIELLSENVDRTKPAIFIINAGGAHTKLYSFSPLAELLHQYFQVYALYTPVPSECFGIQDLAEKYLEEIMKHQAGGRYIIAGFSFGAWIAHCISSILARNGQICSHLIMIEPIPLAEVVLPSVVDFPHQFQCLLNSGKEYIQLAHADSPCEMIPDFARRFQQQVQLLHHYKTHSVTVNCPTTILLASDGPSKHHILSLQKPESWTPWCTSKDLKVMKIPGGHATCIAAINCHHMVEALYPELIVKLSGGIPIRLKHDVLGMWKLKSFCLSVHLGECLKLNEDDSRILRQQSHLVFSADDHYTCMVPHLQMKLVSNIYIVVFL